MNDNKAHKIRLPILNRPGLSTLNNIVFAPTAFLVGVGVICAVKMYFKEKDNFKNFPPEGKSLF